MDFALTDQQESIRDAVAKICEGFDDAYWLNKDREGGFPHDFHKALADADWLGICVPEAYGGSVLEFLVSGLAQQTVMVSIFCAPPSENMRVEAASSNQPPAA